MDYNDVRENINNDMYTAKHTDDLRPQVLAKGFVTDREKSVAWNEDQVALSIKREKAWHTKRRNAENKARDAFRSDLIDSIMDDLGCNQDQAAIIYSEAWEDGHSYGYHEVVSHADSLCTFVAGYVNAGKMGQSDDT